ncbi:SpoIIE family protein phosphatase [Kitasatospora sp. NPDC059146]|uniref:SpoIIE family protein phosphatase n=1 Tax=Kitasatospora sp. NPDC059146 TaxID=3346741 RepID=UPI0036C2EE60
MTAVFAEFSGAAEVLLLSYGHAPLPLVAHDDGVRTVACEPGPPVGLAELTLGEPLLRQEPFVLGQTLVVCSDGVAEARGCGGAGPRSRNAWRDSPEQAGGGRAGRRSARTCCVRI